MSFETPGAKHAPTPRHRAPYDILRAQDLILVHPEIPAKLRLTMQVLVAHANRFKPSQEILVGVSTIAAAIGRDRKTVCRHLNELEALGWILRGSQSRVGRQGWFNSGRFASGCRATLTQKALLGAELVDADVGKDSHQGKMSHGHTGTKLTLTKRQPAPAPTSALPSELSWLSEHLSVPGIFALMKKFTVQGKRLGDAATVLKEHLTRLRLSGGRLFGYLAKLAQSSRCFAMEARQLRETDEREQEERAQRTEADSFRDQIVGKTLVKQGGRTTVFVENRQFAQTTIEGVCGSHPIDDAWLLKLKDALQRKVFCLADISAS